MSKNTNTTRIDTYLHDSEEEFATIGQYVTSVLPSEDRVALVAVWLEQRYRGFYEQLDDAMIDWSLLAEGFVAEFAPVPTEHLPRLVVALLDAARVMREECSALSSSGQSVTAQIERWEREWLVVFSELTGTRITRGELVKRCRHAPPQTLLTALVQQQEALRLRAESGGDDPFWAAGGKGFQALEAGRRALGESWWAYYPGLCAWANVNKHSIRATLDQAHDALALEARTDSFGVIQPVVQLLHALREVTFGPRE